MPVALCPPSADLERLFLGGVPDREADTLEQHVLECNTCLTKLKELLPANDLLSETLAVRKSAQLSTLPPPVTKLIAKLSSLAPRRDRSLHQETPMIAISCSSCQKKLSVKDTLAGKEFECPSCGQVTAVPIPVAAGPRSNEDQTLPPGPASEPAYKEQPLRADASNCPTHSSVSSSEATRGTNASDSGHDSSLTDFLSPPQADDELGRLGNYRIVKILGHGGMGVVYKAEDPKLERFVAIKAMLPTLAASASAGKRFLREAQAMAKVKHDHIVTIHQVDEERGVPFLAMEFLAGEPLDERLEREPGLPLPEVLRIGREIAEDLAAAHATGLIHRDIKPGNIWLEAPRNRVKILDFGLARAVSEDAGLTQQGAIIGTPAYMAPEQGRGDPVDARCDQFSLGVVLYRLCCGQQPFQGKDTVSTLMAVATQQPVAPLQINAGLPPELSDLVMKLLEKDPAGRIGSAGEVVQALQTMEKQLVRQRESEEETGALNVAPPNPVPAGPAKPARSTGLVGVRPVAPRSRRPLLIAALLLIGLLGVGALALIRIQTEQGDYVIDTDDPDFFFQAAKGTVTLEDRKTNRKYTMKVLRQEKGEHELEVTDAGLDLTFKTKTITITRGEKVVAKAWFERKSEAKKQPQTTGDDAWLEQVAAMSTAKQVEAVIARLKERNPDFSGDMEHMVTGGMVTGVNLSWRRVKDLAPLRPLPGLLTLKCNANFELADLSPLKDMKLTDLDCSQTRVADLTPLKDMMLRSLSCDRTGGVSDLTPLKNMRLAVLNCVATKVSDLTPLKDMMLTDLRCHYTKVSDLTPLKDMKLTVLGCAFTPVADLTPLKNMRLTGLECQHTLVSDLSPLKGMPLTDLNCNSTKVSDLTPLKDMMLTGLDCSGTPVSDLSPLKGMPLTTLHCSGSKVSDLSPLKGLPLKELSCDFKPERDAEILRSIKTLTTINGKPAAEFWKEVDAKK